LPFQPSRVKGGSPVPKISYCGNRPEA
jgi:hypothetical protein